MTFENKANLPEKLLKPYNAADIEESIYKIWEESGFFNPDVCIERGITDPNAESFSIVLPPPNVTGTLHTGHAFMLVIQDIMVRFHRMRGKKTLWLPGTDHAAIATQSVVEKELEKEKIKKTDLGREEFLNRVNKFAQDSHDTIVGQIRKMGSSVDWSREAFTLDEKRGVAVNTAFKQMYDDGLIYRGYRIVNWDPKGQTVISDDETNHEERDSMLYTFKYWADFPISISTTRPETKVGDTAVAVHPSDERYKQFIGNTYNGEFCGVPISIKIVADESVEPEFGTGALGVTPAHSQIDWDIAKRHNLDVKPVINEYAKMIVGDERILGKKTTEARETVVEYLRTEGLLEKEEAVKQNVAVAERSKGIIEPLPKLQWFVDVNKKIESRDNKSLKELMLDAVRTDGIEILPNQFEKVYFHWIENLRDWCISRQIWYGHRIPVWYKDEEVFAGLETPGSDWTQDEDTLDTWFSAGLWTFSTLGWPEQTNDLKTYHPTSVLETGNDILFFWVARMILMSKYLLNENPFKTVYLHGMVLDKNGKKMSKSNPATAIDPLETVNKFGADALRMSMIVSVGPGQPTTLTEDKIKAYSKFANKIWNATRFVMEQTYELDLSSTPEYDAEDQQSIDELHAFIKEITTEIEEFKFYLVSEKLYHYFWHTFADIIIERSKKKITENNNSNSAQWVLHTHLVTLIKALHPFMPFITEEIWSLLPKTQHGNKNRDILMVSVWPE
jgi:valyl-tRNA synthetase